MKQIIAVDSSRLPREVVRTVVAVSGHKEDNFRRVGPRTAGGLVSLSVTIPDYIRHIMLELCMVYKITVSPTSSSDVSFDTPAFFVGSTGLSGNSEGVSCD